MASEEIPSRSASHHLHHQPGHDKSKKLARQGRQQSASAPDGWQQRSDRPSNKKGMSTAQECVELLPLKQNGIVRDKNVGRGTSGIKRLVKEHSFLTDVADVRAMEQGLLQLLGDFHSGKLRAFSDCATFDKMDQIREKQERLARLHFELDIHQDLHRLGTEEARTTASETLSKLIDQEEFEAAFRKYDADVTFNYLKSFRRARVNFSSTEQTVQARLELNETELCGQQIKCFFAQIPKISSEDHLQLPKPEKMFLISPPCSPPVGWEQMPESEPVINFELIAALSQLSPGETHELHPASDSQPGIVVHVCEDPEGYTQHPSIVQTRCPERK